MGCSERNVIVSFAFLAAAAVLITFLVTHPNDFQTHFSTPPEEPPLTTTQTGGYGVLTHRDAHHIPEKGEGSSFFARHNVSGRLQAQKAYWAHLTERQLRGSERRQLFSTQQVQINGSLEETGNYFVTMQLGTPPQDVTLLLDSGSSLFWTECNDCPDCTGLLNVTAFLASQSTTLTTPSCGMCQDYQYGLCSANRNNSNPSTDDYCFSVCSKNRRECFYGYAYADGSMTTGYIQKDKLTIPSKDGPPLVADVTFGCNKGDGDGPFAAYYELPEAPNVSPAISGLLGLSKGNYSVLNQLVKTGAIERKFGHCLAGLEGGGLFTLGGETRKVPGMGFTKMGSHKEWYNATIKSIHVGNTTLRIPDSVFYARPRPSARGPSPLFVPDAIFDSGTTFTILPDAAYVQLTAKFLTIVRYEPVYVDQYGNIISAPSPLSPSTTPSPKRNPAAAPSALPPAFPPSRSLSSARHTDWLCFAIPPTEIDASGNFDVSIFPPVSFEFDGAVLTVRPDDYLVAFQLDEEYDFATIACPTFASDQGRGTTIIGETSMRNQYMVFDSVSGLIGIAPTNCTTLL